MSTEHFYRDLPLLPSFLEVTNPDNFAPVPEDWFIVITDICNSTKAIEAGRYREVNLIGACSISVILNLARDHEVPFVFGGDGATVLVPAQLVHKVRKALPALQYMAKTAFNMGLRVGIVPVAHVVRAGYEVKVAKLKISENYSQAMLTGGGLNYATDLIKDPITAEVYNLTDSRTAKADFSGLECRWQDIPSRHGEVVSLLVLAMAHHPEKNYQIYRDVIERIQEIYGDDDYVNPVSPGRLKLSFSSRKLMAETKLRAKSSRWLDRKLYLIQIKLENLLGFFFMKFKVTLGAMPWGSYREIVTAATDYKKFDDALRMTIAGTPAQRERLSHYLEEQLRAGKLVYGLHASDRALMTCLVFERHGRQVHFIDGADGGYALAAKPMKQQLQQKVNNWRAFTEIAKRRPGSSVNRNDCK